MKPRITVLTLGVDILEKAVEFYRDGSGFQTQGIIGTEFEFGAVAFFDLQAGLKIALWPRTSIAHDTSLSLQPASATDMTIGHNVGRHHVQMDTPKNENLSIFKAAKKKWMRSWSKPEEQAQRS